MRKVATWALTLALTATVPAYAEPEAATLIADMWGHYRSVGTEREESEILIVAHPSPPQFSKEDALNMLHDTPTGVIHKRAVRDVAYLPDGQGKLHILFSLPAEDAGLGFLAWRHADAAQDETWTFMPGYEEVRRVPLNSRQKLAGMNFSYEDVRQLMGEQTSLYDYQSVATEELDGRPCRVIRATPHANAPGAYASRKIWVDQGWVFPMKVEYYDGGGKPCKIMRNAEVHEIAPGAYRADLSEMRDLQLNEATLLLVTKRTLGQAIAAQVFTRDYLQHPDSD